MKARIYLVDDEQPVLDGLTVTLHKLVSEVEICGTSRSGRDAIEGITREKPDIVLMDVRMPGMSGLDALRELRRLAPDTLPILLTAYERFDIAREAFSLGVYDYLVKPVEQETLVQSVRGALARLSERKEASLRAAAAMDELELARPLLEAGFVYEAILGTAGNGLLRSYAQRLGLSEGTRIAGRFAAIGKRKTGKDPAGIVGKEDVQALRSAIAYRLSCVVGSPVGGILPVFVSETDAVNADAALEEALSAVQDRSLHAGLGSLHAEGELSASWSEALASFALCGGNRIDETRKTNDSACQVAFEAAARGDVPAAAEAFAHWVSTGQKSDVERAALAGALAVAAGGREKDALAAGTAQAAIRTEEIRGLEDGALRAASLLGVALVSIIPPEAREESGGADRRVRIALGFIAEHYGEPISLEDAAELVAVSPAHLSRLLVATTGASFTEHLTERRIERARKELTEGTRSVKEIASLCGYPDANYFSRAFKKVVGLTPSDYGNRHGRSIV